MRVVEGFPKIDVCLNPTYLVTDSISGNVTIDPYEAAGYINVYDSFIDQLRNKLYMPTSCDSMGCTTATSAFLMDYLGASRMLPAELDTIVGRKPDQATSTLGLGLELLRNGICIDEYGGNPFADSFAKPYANGEIDFATYLEAFKQHISDVAPENIGELKRYTDEDVVPQLLTAKKVLEPYIDDGTFCNKKRNFTPELFSEVLTPDTAVMLALKNDNGTSHMVAIIRPNMLLPAITFSPGLNKSYLWYFNNDTLLNSIDYLEPVLVLKR